MGFYLFIAQVRLQALLLNYFPSNHLLMQLAITPATTEMKNVKTSYNSTHPLSVARLEIRVSNGFILSQVKLVLDLLLVIHFEIYLAQSTKHSRGGVVYPL